MKEAMEQVKAEMGSDAVILHTKKYKEGGILGYGSQEMVEVTAALEEEPASAKKQPKPSENGAQNFHFQTKYSPPATTMRTE